MMAQQNPLRYDVSGSLDSHDPSIDAEEGERGETQAANMQSLGSQFKARTALSDVTNRA